MFFFLWIRQPTRASRTDTRFPCTTLVRAVELRPGAAPPDDLATGAVPEDVDVGADDRHHHPAGHLVAWHAQLGVHARHDHVETLEHVLVLVERAVLEDVDLDAGEDPERSQLLVQALDLVDLLEPPPPVEPARDGQTRQVDRKSVLSGISVSVRVDLGGWRIIKKKKH